MRRLFIGLGLLLAIAAVSVFVFLKRQQVVLDSTEVERMAANLLPGAKPPAGMKGVLGLHPEGLDVAFFASSLAQAKPENLGGADLRILIARPDSPQPARPPGPKLPGPAGLRQGHHPARPGPPAGPPGAPSGSPGV